jgi:hypothetical protein
LIQTYRLFHYRLKQRLLNLDFVPDLDACHPHAARLEHYLAVGEGPSSPEAEVDVILKTRMWQIGPL